MGYVDPLGATGGGVLQPTGAEGISWATWTEGEKAGGPLRDSVIGDVPKIIGHFRSRPRAQNPLTLVST